MSAAQAASWVEAVGAERWEAGLAGPGPMASAAFSHAGLSSSQAQQPTGTAPLLCLQ